MSDLPAVANAEMAIYDMVNRVFALTDLRPSTRKTYVHAAKSLTAWATGRALHVRILVEYKDHLNSRTSLSAKTKNLYLAAARTVFRELFTLGVLAYDASKPVRAFEITRGHKRPPVSDKQVERAFAYVARKRDKRLLLILNLLFRQGLRQKEVVDVRVEDFNEHAATLAILGKGRDDREAVHLHPETVRALTAYLTEQGMNSGYIFASRKRAGGHIGTSALYKIVREVHAACGIANSPHTWRKVFTSKLIESGLNLLDVQAFTRHRSLEQLRVYNDRISFQKSLPAYYRAFGTDHLRTNDVSA